MSSLGIMTESGLFYACMPENEKTKDCFIPVYFKKVPSSWYAAGESGVISLTGVWRDENWKSREH